MKLPWQKNKAPAPGAVKMRAAVVPMVYRFEVIYGATDNNITVNSWSTHIVTLQLLQPGQTAKDVAKFGPGQVNFGGPNFTKEEERERNLQRVQFDAPNWVGVIVSTEGMVHYANVELPVWADPDTGKIHSVDVDDMLAEMEPKRQRASEIWGEIDGPFALYFQLKSLPRDVAEFGKEIASIPKTWFGAIKDMVDDMKGEGKPPEPLPDHMKPDLSQYPPVEGIDYETYAMLSARPEKITEAGIPMETWTVASKEWQARMMKDWKLGAQFGNDVDRIRKTR